MFNRKWIYNTTDNGCLGVIVETEEQYEDLKGAFSDSRHGKVTVLPFASAKKLVNSAKEAIKEEKPAEEKPKRKRRTKAEIEADKENDSKEA